MKIATWNVNSVRARLDRLLAWLQRTQPDIVCLQELKATKDAFLRPHVPRDQGVALVRQLAADAEVDDRKDDVLAAARMFAPHGCDAALLTAGGKAADQALKTMRDGGRVAYPNGVEPEPRVQAGVKANRRSICQRLDEFVRQ